VTPASPDLPSERVDDELNRPELNPLDNVWQYMRDNWLSNRVFTYDKNTLDDCADAWKRPADQPWTIMSIGLRNWAYRS
jgi:transposase